MKLIPLRNKKREIIEYTMVDDEDFEWLNQFRWSLHTRGKNRPNSPPRVSRSKPRGDVDEKFMHRFIWKYCYGLAKNQMIDHKDLNPLNNQKENLRLCNGSQNCANVFKATGLFTSKYKGVHYDKLTEKWHGTITLNGKRIHLGCFLKEIDAAIAYDIRARQLFGDFARTNFRNGEISIEHIKKISEKIDVVRSYSSKYYGVRKSDGMWRATCYIKKDKSFLGVNVGCFNNEEDAALARDYFILNLCKNSKRIKINFPQASMNDFERIKKLLVQKNIILPFENKIYK